MNRKHTVHLLVPALLSGLLAACGGSGPDSGTPDSGAAPRLLAGGRVVPDAAATTWNSVKFGGGGYVTGLIFHPASPKVLYARTDIGGAYRWNHKTSSWTPITDGLGFGAAESRFHGVDSIAVDPTDDQLVYMVTGMYTFEGNGRLYISSDRGDHWAHVDLPFPVGGNNGGRAMGERLMVDPNLPSTLFYASRTAGLWKSADSGRTWAQVASLSAATMTQDQVNAFGGSAMGVELVVYDTDIKGPHKAKKHPGDGATTRTIYAAIAPDYASVAGLASSMYKSTDGGESWAPVATPVQGYHIPHMVRADDGVFYVVFTQGAGPGAGGPARLYKFDGSNWTLLKSEDPDGGTNFGMGGLSVSGRGASTRIALGVTNSWGNWNGQQIVQLSDDGGQTWREIEAMTPGETASGWVDDVEIDPFNPDHILHVHGGGILETWDASSATPAWKGTIAGIEETATIAVATPPAGAPYILINSAGDVGTWVDTDLAATPTQGPGLGWSNGNSADMAWSDPLYIAAIGVVNWSGAVAAHWSGDGGKTWEAFASLPQGAQNTSGESNIVVTARNRAVWAPANSVPSYTTDNGATWTPTNLPALSGVGINRGYRLAADRRNPNKVYAYNSGGAWWNQWSDTAHFWYSADGGRTFTESASFKDMGAMVTAFGNASLAVNPNAEGDIWLADGNAIYHSTDSGANWTKITRFASVWGGSNQFIPVVQGATLVALGKAAAGAPYSSAVYVAGAADGQWGVYRSDDGGASWTRFNDDAHQYGGIGVMAADQNIYGRIYFSGTGRGLLYTN
ncbi:sialidase family protein [Massilia endophytica]|uniref:sialidase family protein n=1 Tax=Massilia endophytica TaxID=2899220 RepID=UPI001E3F3515|nr:sialidase family protein [Massilia endophytica]UGQ48794.1 dockerin [Massilia endophytica]